MTQPGQPGQPGRPVTIEPAPLAAEDIDAVLALVDRAAAEDGVGALSEHARLHLRRGGGTDLIAREGDGKGGVVGYAHADGDEAELVVDPRARRQGVGTQLLDALSSERTATAAGTSNPIRVWAHGDRPAAAAFARARGATRARELWQMQRALTGSDAPPLPESDLRDGLRLRTFRVGEDERAWLGVNSRAFADHPEQGAWTLTDLREREAGDWFDPEGFFLAVDDSDGGALAGFHWTKEHHDAGAAPIGEVYVLAVDPAYQGRGLGPALTAAGLRHLASRGLPAVMLYVDGDNAAGIATYRKLGFERSSLDVMYEV